MDWLTALNHLRETRTPGVLVTLVSVRGHSPRDAGAKMVVTADAVYDTIGGGNLEAVAIARAREGVSAPTTVDVQLSDKAPYEHGVQCCGGEVSVLFEPLAVLPSVAIFGMGHVGLELARILARHEVELHLIDSRPEQLDVDRIGVLDDGRARVYAHREVILPELALAALPTGSHILVMTHDHGEDLAICDAALRTPGLVTIGLIGSASKWARFRQQLHALGHDDAALAHITTPIGLPEIEGKEPAVIAVSVAAALLARGLEVAERPVVRKGSR